VPWYYRVKAAINVAAPFLAPTQVIYLALLVSAILKKRIPSASRSWPELIRLPKSAASPPQARDLLHRVKRLWRFIDNERAEAIDS
jgi:hypothetical protein